MKPTRYNDIDVVVKLRTSVYIHMRQKVEKPADTRPFCLRDRV